MVPSRPQAVRLRPARRVRGRFSLPGDKSISHRLGLLSAVAEGESVLENFAAAADCASTLACLEALGVEVRRVAKAVRIVGRGFDGLRPPRTALDAGNSGSTMRMLAGLLAGRPFAATLTGDASLLRRPMERVAEPLRAMGAELTTTAGRPPLTLRGGPLRGIEWPLAVASAQVKTAILLAGLQAEGTTSVREPAATRDHTERLLPLYGAHCEREGLTVTVRGGARLRSVRFTVPGDVSSAAFLVVAALIRPGSRLRLDGVLLNPARTGFLQVLGRMGGRIAVGVESSEPEPVGFIEVAASSLSGTEIAPAEVPGLIDEVPALAVAGAFADGRFVLRGAQELRVKESDRLGALAEGLGRMGARVREHPDGIEIEGGVPLRGASVRSFGDHRIAMALAVAALGAEGDVDLDDAECVAVSFPRFFEILAEATHA